MTSIIYKDDDNIYTLAKTKVCTCGHELYLHGFVTLFEIHTIIASQCVVRGCECKRFVEKKPEDN